MFEEAWLILSSGCHVITVCKLSEMGNNGDAIVKHMSTIDPLKSWKMKCKEWKTIYINR